MSQLKRPEEQDAPASTAPENINTLHRLTAEPEPRTPVAVRDPGPRPSSLPQPTRITPQRDESRGVLNTLSRSIAGGLRRDSALSLWQESREAEASGDVLRADSLRNQAQREMADAQNILPEITSYDQIESAADIAPYVTAMVGMNAPSIVRSAIGGGIGSGVARATTRNVASKVARDNAQRAGGLVGAGYMNYDVVRGGIVQEQETDPRFQGMSLEEKERAATLTALGSSALEGIVPGRIGSRALGRIVDLAPGRTAARQTLRNRVQDIGSDMLQEGMTEVLQSQFEETSLDLQAAEMPNLMEFGTFVDSLVGGMAGAGAASGTVMGATEGFERVAARALRNGYQPATFGSNLGALGAEGQATAQQVLNRQFDLLKPQGEVNEKLWNALKQAVVTEPDNFSDISVRQRDGTVLNERQRQREAKDLIIKAARTQFGDFVVDEMLNSYGDFVEGLEGRVSATFTEEERQQAGGRAEDLDVGRVFEEEDTGATTTDDGQTVLKYERLSVLNGEGPPLSTVSDPNEWEFIGTVPDPRRSANEQQRINRPAYLDSEMELSALQETLSNVPEDQRDDVEVLRMDQAVEYMEGNAEYFARSLMSDLQERLEEATRRPDENRESVIAEHTAKLEELESALAEGVPERALSKYAIGVRIPPKTQGLEATLNDIRTMERATEIARLDAGRKGRAEREQFEENLRYVVIQEEDGSQRAVPIDLTTAAADFINRKGGRDFQSTSKSEAKSKGSRDRRIETETLAALFNSPDTRVVGFTTREQATNEDIVAAAATGQKEFDIEADLEKLQRNIQGYSVLGDTESTARDFLKKRREVARRGGAQEAAPRIKRVVGKKLKKFFGRDFSERTSVEIDGVTVKNVFLEGERQGLRSDERARLDKLVDQMVEQEGGIDFVFGNQAFNDTDHLTVEKLLDPETLTMVKKKPLRILQELQMTQEDATREKEQLQRVRKDSIARAEAARKAGQKSYEVTWHDGTKRTIKTKDAPGIHAELQVEADSMFNLSKRMENMLRHVDERFMELRQGEINAASADQELTAKETQEELDKEARDVRDREGGPAGQKSKNELSKEAQILAALQLMNYNKERSAKVLKKVARAWKLKKKLSESAVLGRVKDPVERELLRQAFALLADETGASANVNDLDAGGSSDVVYVVVNDINNYKPGSKRPSTLRYLNELTKRKMGIVLSGRTKKSVVKKFAHVMEGHGYIQHPQHANVFMPDPKQHQLDSTALTYTIQSYNNALDRWGDGERVTETVEQAALQDELRYWLHHVNHWYGGWPEGFKKHGQSAPINIPKDVKQMFSELGYEFKRGANGVVYVKLVKPKESDDGDGNNKPKVKGQSKTSAERTNETLSSAAEDINNSDSATRKKWARELKKQRQAQRAAWEAVSDWRSKGARKHIYRWLRSMPQSEWGQRALTDLHRGVANNNVRRQIIKLVNDGVIEMDAADRKLFDEDQNFAVAVAWQAWVADQVKLGPKTDTWYYRITQYLLGLFNLQRRSDFATALMQKHQADGLFEPENFKAVYQTEMSLNDRRLHDVMRAADQGYKRFLRSNYQVLVDYGLTELADALHNEEARIGGRKNFKLGFLQAREKNKSKWHQRLNRLLGPRSDLEEGELLNAWEDFIKSKYVINSPSSRAGRRLHTLFDEIYEYLGEAGSQVLIYEGKNEEGKDKWRKVKANKRVNKVPFIINLEYMRSNQNKFRELIAEHGNMDQETAQKVVDSYLYSHGVLSFADDKFDEVSPPYSVGSVSGLLDGILPSKYKYFQDFMRFEDESQLLNLLTQAVNQAVHRAEFDRAGIRKLVGEAMSQMEDRELPLDERQFILNKTIPSMLGTMQNEMNPGWRTAQQVAMSVINYSILPMILFSSIVDIMGPALRTGEMNNAWRTFKTGMREVRNSFTNEEDADVEMAKMFGIIEDSVLHARIGDAYDQDLTVKWIRKANNAFFKYTGMDGWTIGTRVAAMKIGMDYINKHQNDSEKLAELGLKKSDLKKDANGEIIWSPENDQLAQGLFRFVDSAVLRPTGAHKPAWGGDPRFMLIWHLKHFMFTFHKVFTERAVNELNQVNPNFRALVPYLSMVPVMMVSDFVRNLLVPSPYYDRMGFFDAVYNAVRRSGVLGLGTFGLDAMQDVTFRQAPGTGFMGPAFGVGYDIMKDGLGSTLWRLLPGYVLWSKLDNHW